MASKYWIKLYYEILDDSKMGQMPDWLWRRAIELFLLAGENGNDGLLPSVADIAWRLRVSEGKLTEALQALSQVGVVHETPDGWAITNFAKRQFSDSYDRVKRYRDKKRYSNGDSNVTPSISISTSLSNLEGGGAGGGGNGAAERAAWESQAGMGDANRILTQASGLAALSGSLIEKISIVQDLLSRYDQDKVQDALQKARDAWVKTPRKDNSGTYSVLNGAWVDWAIAHLAGETPWKGASMSAMDNLLAKMEKDHG